MLQSKVNGFAVSIESGCNGVEATIVLVAAILAFPAPWKRRLMGLVVGVVAVQGLNIIRVISLFYLGQWNLAGVRMGAPLCMAGVDHARRADRLADLGAHAARAGRAAPLMRTPLGRFVLKVLVWLPAAFVVWYFAAPLLLWPVKVLL